MAETVAVAMSGGVDSSVAALLLRRQGFDVIGIYMRNLDPLPGTVDHGDDARRVAAQIGIPLHVVDLHERFDEAVVRYFIDEYRAGRTPNPCARCNRLIKFGALVDLARSLGATRFATGHYARIADEGGVRTIARAAVAARDQSYFLFDLLPDVLAFVEFPLGGFHKDEIRRIAAEAGLGTAQKHDSQDVCFIKGDYRDYLAARGLGPQPGDIVDTGGTRLGSHTGYTGYTVGQRSGLGIAARHPLYVLRTDPVRNLVIVGSEDELHASSLVAERPSVFLPVDPDRTYNVKIRYRHPGAPARLSLTGDGLLRVRFDTPQRGITPGQAVVAYDGDRLACGGWIL